MTVISLEGSQRQAEFADAVHALRAGLHTDAAMIGHEGIAEQYRVLVRLIEAARHRSIPVPETVFQRVPRDLRRYAIFVRFSLEWFITCGEAWDPGKPAYPQLRWQEGEVPLWSPEQEPPGWREALEADPDDPWYKPPA